MYKILNILINIILTLSAIIWVCASPVTFINETDPNHIKLLRNAKVAEIHNYLDESQDPCDNFYKFACGNWLKTNPANSFEQLTTGFFETMDKALDRKIAIMLKVEEDWDTDIDKKVKNFYESCTRLEVLQNTYKEKLVEIAEEFGKIPALEGDKWQEQDFDWLEVVSKIAYKYGTSIVLGYDILPDFTENTANRIYIGYPDFPLESKSMYVDEVTDIYRNSYRKLIVNDLKTFWGLSKDKSKEIAQQILDVEISLAKGMADEKLGLQLGEIAALTTLQEMQQKYSPHLNIIKLVNISLGTLPALNEPVYEMVADYQLNLITVLNTTPKSHLANYIYYTLLKDFMLRLPKKKDELESECITITKKYFAKNLDNMVYRKYTTKNTERDVESMWQEIKLTFKNMLQSQEFNWINFETRKYAVEKLEAMAMEINSYASENFAEQFGDLILNKHDYIQNLQNILVLDAKNDRKALNEPPKTAVDGEVLSYTPVNIIIENKIRVPVLLLQPYYLWSTYYPNALKFGTLGTLVSHELIHGFDDTGRTFDKFGNNREWWDEKSTDAFKERTNCFVDQYKKYIYGGRPLPEMASQSENIADNGGLHLAYEAYLYWYEEALRSYQPLPYETLPRLNYSSKQLFFISYAQLWCSDAHPAVRNLQTSIDAHVPGKYRVIGPLSNFEEFSKEFKCPLGSGMNPVKKCIIY